MNISKYVVDDGLKVQAEEIRSFSGVSPGRPSEAVLALTMHANE
jgi:hypothetical protein